jgi:hypothetical protein
VRLAGEQDRSRRLDILAEFRSIGDRTRPLEERLRDAGRPVPDATASAPVRDGPAFSAGLLGPSGELR